MKRICLAVLMVCLMAEVCFAPIFGLYPGLDKLIERSDAIAIVGIFKQKTSSPSGPFEEYEVLIRRMLKGEAPKNRTVTVSLRCLPHGSKEWTFTIPGTYLIFFKKNNKKGVPYESLNWEGASWELAPSPNLKAIDSHSLREAVKQLLKESLEHKRQELKLFEETVNEVLKETQPTDAPDKK